MKSKVSALMDGELDKQDASDFIEALSKDDNLQEDWKTYHLIGDTLRQSSLLSMNVSSSVNQKLKIEPTVLSPKTPNIHHQTKRKVFAFSMAASVMMLISGWIIVHSSHEPQQTIIAEQPNHRDSNLTVAPVMVSSPTSVHNYPHPPIEINDYLFVHREFSPGTAMRGQVTNVNTVIEYQERYGR